MPFRTWLFAFAIGLTLFASPIWSQGGVQNGENTQDAQTAQQSEPPKPSFVTALEGIETAIRELIGTQSEDERQRQAKQAAKDLEAQAEMAEWAREVGIGTVASALFTFGGLVLIWFTLGHTRRAADYARDMVIEAKATTAAAQETANVTRIIGQKQTKAYVSVTGARWSTKADSITFQIRISNSGNSPALKVFATGDLTLSEALKGADGIHRQQWSERNTGGEVEFNPIPAKGEVSGEMYFWCRLDMMEPVDRVMEWDLPGDANEFECDLTLTWSDVFGDSDHIHVFLRGQRRGNSRSGKMEFVADDPAGITEEMNKRYQDERATTKEAIT